MPGNFFLHETNLATGLFLGGYTDGSSSGGGGTAGGGATGTDPTNTGGTSTPPPSPPPVGLEPVATVSDDTGSLSDGSGTSMKQVEKSNGGEYHGFAFAIGVPETFKGKLKLKFGEDDDEEEDELMKDAQSGRMVLKDPKHVDGDLPFTASFMPHLDPEMDDPPGVPPVDPDADDDDYHKRLEGLKDASFAKGFAWGLGYGGLDMVKSTGETIAGAAKFAGRGAMQVGLRFTWVANWIVGNDNTQVNSMIAEVDAAQSKVVGEGLEVAKFLGTLLLDTAAVLPKIGIGLLTGDKAMADTALHGSETHRKVFSMVSEVLTQTVTDLSSETLNEGPKGYIIGKIFFEVVSFVIPQTKLGKMMEMTKSQLLGKLIDKANGAGSKLLRDGAKGRAAATKLVCDAPGQCFMAGEQVLTKSGSKNIESIQPGDVVWSQNEHAPTQSGWRRVTAVQVRHPREVHHITYELRGPPNSKESVGEASHVTVETLSVTSEHPFWVERGGFEGFVPVKDLREGDVFLRASGGRAELTRMVTEHAPQGQTFTTYNFTVEDFHTYFVGQAGIWVHNACPTKLKPHLSMRENIRSVIFERVRPTQIEDLGRDRFDKLADAKGAFDNAGIKVPKGAWLTESWDCCNGMFDDFANGKILTKGGIPNGPPDLPSVTEWNALLKGNKRWAPWQGADVHHSVEKWIQRDYLGLTGNFDDVPGWIIDTAQHTFGQGRGLTGTLAGDLKTAFANVPKNNPLAAANALKQVYKSRDLDNLWLASRQWLISKGLPVPSP